MGKILTNLKAIREDSRMTQQELADKSADKIDAQRKTVLHLENNRYNPSLEMALKIARVFGMSVEDIFRLNEEV